MKASRNKRTKYLPAKHLLDVGQGVEGTVVSIWLLWLLRGDEDGDGLGGDCPVGELVGLLQAPLIHDELPHKGEHIAPVALNAVKQDDEGLVLELGSDVGSNSQQ